MRKLYLLILIAILSLQVEAQSFVKLTRTQFPNFTKHYGDTILLSDSLYSTSGAGYTGTIRFYSRINQTIHADFDTASFILDTSSSVKTAYTIVLPVTPANFVNGPNGVIIWPLYAGGSAGPNDTIRFTAYVSPLGLDEAPLARLYVWQGNNYLNVNFGDYQNLIQQVRLYNVDGQLLYNDAPEPSQRISTSGWSSGVYFCEITTYQGERRTIKFVLQ